ncbi:MAG: RDD family protein, partial [Bacteroidota bacterium]
MDSNKFNIDNILQDSGKSFQKNPYRSEQSNTTTAEQGDRPWHHLAPHQKRIAAFLLDYLSIFLLVAVFYYLFLDFGPILDDYLIDSSGFYTKMALWEQVSFIQWATLLIWIAYGTIMEGSERKATFGKQYMQLQVVDQDGEQLSLGKAAGRNVSKILSQMFWCLGFLWSFWDSDRQTWHDKIVKTYVVEEEVK